MTASTTSKRHIPTRMLILSALFCALTAVGAYIRIPTPWSAFTLQVLFVFMAGALLGPKYGALSQAAYVALGLVGIPVFTGVLRPTFGFLLSCVPAAYVVGRLCRTEGTPTVGRIAAACAAGLGVIYAVGLPYMAAIVNGYLGAGMTAREIVMSGMVLFLPFDALKIVLTVILARVLSPPDQNRHGIETRHRIKNHHHVKKPSGRVSDGFLMLISAPRSRSGGSS